MFNTVVAKKAFITIIIFALTLIAVPVVVFATSGSATVIWTNTLTSGATYVDTDIGANIVIYGMDSGNISAFNHNGTLLWENPYNSSIRKVILNPAGTNFTALTSSGLVIYGNAHTGSTYWEFNGTEYTYYNATIGGYQSGDPTVDADMDRPGTHVAIATTTHFFLIDYANNTLAVGNLTPQVGPTPSPTPTPTTTTPTITPTPTPTSGTEVITANVRSGWHFIERSYATSWSTLFTAAASDSVYDGFSNGTLVIGTETDASSYKRNFRTMLMFDTSSIPVDAVVDSASIQIYLKTNNFHSADITWIYPAYDSSGTYPTIPMVIADYNIAHYSPSIASGVHVEDWAATPPGGTGWHTITLTSDAYDMVNIGGMTKIAFLTSMELNAYAPRNDYNDGLFCGAGISPPAGCSGNEPTLTVSWSIPTPTPTTTTPTITTTPTPTTTYTPVNPPVNSPFVSIALDPDSYYLVLADDAQSIFKYNISGIVSPPVYTSWYQGYAFRQQHNITGSADGYLESWNGTYIRVFNTTGAATGKDMYVGNAVKPDFSDVRIVDPDTNDLLRFYINSYGSDYANITYLFDNLTQLEDKGLYVYWGNASADPYSDSTGEVGDDIGVITLSNTTLEADFEYGTCTPTSCPPQQNFYLWGNPGNTVPDGGTGISGYPIGPALPDYNYSTHGIASGGIHGSVNTGGGYGNWYVAWHTFSGINGTPGVSGHGMRFLFDFKIENDCSGLVSPIGVSGVSIDAPGTMSNGTPLAYADLNCFVGSPGSTISDIGASSSITGSSNSNATYVMHGGVTSTGGWGWFDAYIDNITDIHRWISAKPTDGTWGSVENIIAPPTIDVNDAINLGDYIVRMDAPWNGHWVAVSAETSTFRVQLNSTAFQNIYDIIDLTGTPMSMSVVDSGVRYAEARGAEFQIRPDLCGDVSPVPCVWTSGTDVYSGDIATTSGLWATSGGQDGKVYIYTREDRSSWELAFSSDASGTVNATAISPDAQYVAIGRASGNAILYQTVLPVPTTPGGGGYIIGNGSFWQDVIVYRGSTPYPGLAVTIYENTGGNTTFHTLTSRTSDSSGQFNFFAYEGSSYMFVSGSPPLNQTRYASSTHATIYLMLESIQPPAYVYSVNATGDANVTTITYIFNSQTGVVNWVNVTIIDQSTGSIVATRTYPLTSSISDVIDTGVSGHTMQVSSRVYQSGRVWSLSEFVSPLANEGQIGANLIPALSVNEKNALFIVLLMVIAGLFSWTNSHRGAIIVVGVALAMRYAGLISVDPAIILTAAAFAILSAFIRGSRT